MKKIMIGFIALFTFINLNAQTEKGTIYLGGTINVSSNSNSNNTKTSSFSLIPDAGYFFRDNMAIGLGIGYAQSKSTSQSGAPIIETTVTQGTFSINPTFRYYMPTSSETFKFFLQARLNFDFGTTKTETSVSTSTTTEKSNGSGFFVSPNFSYFPTRRWSIDIGFVGIGYSTNSNNASNITNTSSSFQLSINSFSPSLGVRAFIGKK